MRHLAGVVLSMQVVAMGCGTDSPNEPTPRTFTYEASGEGPVAARSFACISFSPEAPGPAYVHFGLTGPTELGTGTCTGSRNVVVRSDTGEVSATLPAGDSFARFENTLDTATRYRLTIRYLKLY